MEKEIDRKKTEFVSLASHQLRTPLSTISWYAEMLSESGVGVPHAEQVKKQKKYLDEVIRGNKRMIALVNALLNVSRLELGTFYINPEKKNIGTVLDATIHGVEHQIKEKNLKLNKKYSVKTSPTFNIDPNLVRIIFENLLSNAVKYTPDGGAITVSMRKNKHSVVVEVSDTGMGIPKKQQAMVFKKLFRADNVRELGKEGTGLGLYIIKSILDSSGGEIKFVSKENKGTSFFVSLPLSGMKAKEGEKGLA